MPDRFDRAGFCTRIRQARVEACGEDGIPGLTRALGIPPKTWANYEMGVTMPDSILLRFLCLTGTSPCWLATGDGLPQRPHLDPIVAKL